MPEKDNKNLLVVDDRVINKKTHKKATVKKVGHGTLSTVDIEYDDILGIIFAVGISKLEKIEDERKQEQVI